MSISPLPPAPQTTDPANFDTRADALIAALPTFISECNATAAAMDFNDTNGTSSTSILIGTGSKVFTASTAKSWQLGMTLRVASTASPINFMTGEVTAYNTGTGSLTVNVTNTSGSGTLAAWTISQAGVSLQAPVIDLTGYSGADVALGIGQSAIYTVTAVTSLLLRIATANNQIYDIDGIFNSTNGDNSGPTLKPNNAAASSVLQYYFDGIGSTPRALPQIAAGLSICTGVNIALTKMTAYTSTTAKTLDVNRYFGNSSVSIRQGGGITNLWLDTTTAWTSLGTFDFVNALTGMVKVTRKL
jgi:hypothetical protein